jgi:hypothetical protein
LLEIQVFALNDVKFDIINEPVCIDLMALFIKEILQFWLEDVV